VVTFLSPEWVDALNDAAASLRHGLTTRLCVEHVVGDFVYHVDYRDERVTVHLGAADEPTVRLHADYETAAAIARGELSAQRAFMTGRVRIDGDVLALAGAQTALRTLPDPFADVRSTTEW
jgi:SCP-2 sterol transfer family